MIRLLLVDDHDLFRHGLRRMLEDINEIAVLGEASSGEQAWEFCRRNTVDVVLMDTRMPGIGGVEATRRIVRMTDGVRLIDSTRVLALSGSKSEHISSQFMQAGATGFISKDASFPDLLRAIHSVYNGSAYLCGELAGRMAQRSGKPAMSPFELLSPRELQICLLIVDCKKISFIAEQLHVSPKTVNTYRYRIFEKLNVSGDVALTHLAIRFGLIEAGAAASG